METSRVKTAALVLFIAALSGSHLPACSFFAEAPPTLDFDLDSIPGKSVAEIFGETTPPVKANAKYIVSETVRKLAARARSEDPAGLIEETDRVIAAVRADGGDHQDLALLHDLRDGLKSAPQDCAAYLQWRVDHRPMMFPPGEDPNEFPQKPPAPPPASLLVEIDKNATDATGPIRAHWLYLHGAIVFNFENKAEAQKWFDKVVQEFPDQPRAEMALFMSGRCLLAQSRQEADFSTPPDESKRIQDAAKARHTEAIARFREYLKKYPNGRFAADAYGWLGALDDGVESLDDYIREVETPGHPEVLKSGMEMIQQRLDELVTDTPDAGNNNAPAGTGIEPDTVAAFDLIAKHPKVAMAAMYVALTGVSEDTTAGDHIGISPLVVHRKKWRTVILPRLASAVAAQKDLYIPGAIWQPRYLAILAHAASESGAQEDALKLTESNPHGPEQTDDLLYIRALAFQRAGKTAEAIGAFEKLLIRFPSSPLTPGARVRYGIALRDHHESGRAIRVLQKFLDQEKANEKAGLGGDPELLLRPYVPPDTVRQVIDSMMNFSPLPELAAALEEKGIDPGFAADLKRIIAARALAAEDFATARKYMVADQFSAVAGKLEALSLKVKAAENNAQKAALEAQLGDAWAAARGQLLRFEGLPANFGDQPELAGINRSINGEAMGYAGVEEEFDDRDELHHAARWWMRAARHFPGTPLSASCRLQALEAMNREAGDSEYMYLRAVKENLTKASREIYDKLQVESPNSDEARQAAYWSFVAPANAGAADYYSDGVDVWDRLQSGYRWPDLGLETALTANDAGGDRAGWEEISNRIKALRDTQLSVPELAAGIKGLRTLARARFSSHFQDPDLNFLDDLALFLDEKAVTDEIARRYLNLRLDFYGPGNGLRREIGDALADPAMKSVADYLEFLNLAMTAYSRIAVQSRWQPAGKDEANTFLTCDYPTLEKMARAFLEKYPHSHKREAARLLLARAVYKQSWPRIQDVDTSPAEPKLAIDQWEPLNPKRVLAELDAYDREFPQGRYSPEIRDMRAGVCWRTGDWKPALDLTLRQLDEKIPDLHEDAVLRLANIYAELAVARNRPGIMAAIRENPAALPLLKVYLATASTRGHPLRFLTAYLQDQLHFQLPPAGEDPPSP